MRRAVFIFIISFLALATLSAYQYFHFHDGKLHIVFCNVGQGDGILITTPSNKQILVDAGPDKSILSCLSKYMPFWDRSIDISLLTHPHADHFMGYYYVIDRYRIDQFSTEELKNKSEGFEELEEQLKLHHLSTQYVAAGDTWKISDGVTVRIVGPTREFLFGKNPDGFITNSAESASLTTFVSYGNFSMLLTGDAPVDEMTQIADLRLKGLDILQIPHHGSSTGVDKHVIDFLAPTIAVISVGKNSYGHPTPQTLRLLKERGITALRTDQRGNVEIVTDGQEWRY